MKITKEKHYNDNLEILHDCEPFSKITYTGAAKGRPIRLFLFDGYYVTIAYRLQKFQNCKITY